MRFISCILPWLRRFREAVGGRGSAGLVERMRLQDEPNMVHLEKVAVMVELADTLL